MKYVLFLLTLTSMSTVALAEDNRIWHPISESDLKVLIDGKITTYAADVKIDLPLIMRKYEEETRYSASMLRH